ncbi:MAG: hypothetical protein LBH94_01170 [Deltaproteobacteria bacterium]|jgi:hypothetical protein|nr:hypothetical protein [Deltaproteobacteria bacterium]
MQKIHLSQAQAGMALASDVTSDDGRVIAAAGSPVANAMLRRLDLAGVTKLVVQGAPVPGADMGYDAQGRAQRIEYLFRRHQDDPFMMSLKSMLLKHFSTRV